MRFGTQTFGPWYLIKDDLHTFASNIKKSGYELVELCLAPVRVPEDPEAFLTPEQFDFYYKEFTNEGLLVESVHVITSDIISNVSLLRDMARKYNLKLYVFGCPQEGDESVYKKYSDELAILAMELKEDGVTVAIHNLGNEIANKINGMTAYEYILVNAKGAVKAEPDFGWIVKGGEDPVALTNRIAEYVTVLHFKDMELMADGSYEEIAIGCGVVDFEALYRFGQERDMDQYMDQDSSRGDFYADLDNCLNIIRSMN